MQLLKFKIDLLTFTIAHTSIFCPLVLVLFSSGSLLLQPSHSQQLTTSAMLCEERMKHIKKTRHYSRLDWGRAWMNLLWWLCRVSLSSSFTFYTHFAFFLPLSFFPFVPSSSPPSPDLPSPSSSFLPLMHLSHSKEHCRVLSQSVFEREVYFQPGKYNNSDAIAVHALIEKHIKVKTSLRQQPLNGPKVMFIWQVYIYLSRRLSISPNVSVVYIHYFSEGLTPFFQQNTC